MLNSRGIVNRISIIRVASSMRAYKQVNDHTLELTNKKDGKVTAASRIVVSADDKSRTVTVHGADANGKKITSTSVYDKD